MAHGNWGGLSRPLNMLVTRAFFGVTALYMKVRSARNRRRWKAGIVAGNIEHSASKMAASLAEGYTKLNIGGGSKNLRGFVNVDFVPHPSVEREIVAEIL